MHFGTANGRAMMKRCWATADAAFLSNRIVAGNYGCLAIEAGCIGSMASNSTGTPLGQIATGNLQPVSPKTAMVIYGSVPNPDDYCAGVRAKLRSSIL